MATAEAPPSRPGVLYASVGLIALCGVVYELLIGATSSYLLGDSLFQFSITVGIFMSALGLGSWLSQLVRDRLFACFLASELAISAVGGGSAALLFWSYTLGPGLYPLVQYGLTLVIGTLVGLELPLLMRMLEARHELRINAATMLTLDYAGGLLGSLAFPLLLFPHLGLVRTALAIGALNALVAAVGIWRYGATLASARTPFTLAAGAMGLVLGLALYGAPGAERSLEQGLYRDRILVSEQTPYQHLTLTEKGHDLRLFINGNLQYSSLDEYRYHESLIHVPIGLMAAVPRDVLILGGGDGLAARELLKYAELRRIDLVDLDPEMPALHRRVPALVALNHGSLSDPRLTLHAQDAMKFLEASRARYDLIVIDLPDPNSVTLCKLFSRELYRLAGDHLRAAGALVVQASSPYFSREAYWCIAKTVASADLAINPYHVDVPSFGDWGFVIGSPRRLPDRPWQPRVAMRYLTPALVPGFFQFGRDEDGSLLDRLAINTLFHPVLFGYYEHGWGKDR